MLDPKVRAVAVDGVTGNRYPVRATFFNDKWY